MRGRRQGGPIDWTAVRERLARAQAATEAALSLPLDRSRAIMDARARALARTPAVAPPPGSVLEALMFSLGSERYAVEAAHVREVVRLEDFTPVPGAPAFLVGVTNLRGEILAVVDLRRFFGVEPRGLTDLSRVVVLGHERAEVGVLADEAHALVGLRAGEIMAPPESIAGIGREYLLGVTQDALIVLDGAALLADPRLFIDSGVPSAPAPRRQ